MAYAIGMTLRTRVTLFLALIAFVGAFVWNTTASLPAVVASHFDVSGLANGYMPRGMYLTVLLIIVVGAPLLLAYLPYSIAKQRATRLNIPHRSYWLAPQRVIETQAFLWHHGLWFAAMLAVFLAYVHWLVVAANRLQPPRIDNDALILALAAFSGGVIVWLVTLWRRFRLPR
jgi:uncharacterized membrane protein